MPRQRLNRGGSVRGHKYRIGAYTDELDNQPEYHPRTDSDLREIGHRAREEGRLVLPISLVGKPSSEGAAADHYSRLVPSIETGEQMERFRSRTRPAAVVQLLLVAVATWAPAAAGDDFGTSYWEGEAVPR